jgi:CheY-like chemotaxis protein
MPARIVVVHDDPRKVIALAEALRAHGYEVTRFPDALSAYDALGEAHRVDLLITRIQFDDGRSNGFSLAKWGLTKSSSMQVLFVAPPEFEPLTKDLGEFLPRTASVDEIVAKAGSMLDAMNLGRNQK